MLKTESPRTYVQIPMGRKKLLMALIGSGAKPRCFKIRPPPVPYLSQKKLLVLRAHVQVVGLRHISTFIRKSSGKNVALFMDNCGPHGADLTDSLGQVTIFTLPPN